MDLSRSQGFEKVSASCSAVPDRVIEANKTILLVPSFKCLGCDATIAGEE